MVWLLADQTDYTGRHNGNAGLPPDSLPEIEAHLQKTTIEFHMRGRRKMWERGKQARAAETKTAETAEVHTDSLLADVARKLGVDEEVPLELWKDKLEVFCTRYAHHEFTTPFYGKVIPLIFEVKRYANETTPDKHRIKRLIKQIQALRDQDNKSFRDRFAASFTYDEEGANIMDTLDNLPEELKEEKSPEAPSRARSRSRSPDPRHSPLPQGSPRAPARGGAGGGGFTKQRSHLSELLEALHALL